MSNRISTTTATLFINKHRFLSTEVEEKKPQQQQEQQPMRIFTIPNGLTLSRILVTPYINYLVLIERHESACLLFALASLTDFLDGYIARKWPRTQMSPLGSILDPFADKFLIGTLTISLTLAHMMPLELAVIILGRDLGLIVASLVVYFRMKMTAMTTSSSSPIGRIQVEADKISKFNTFLQISLITLTLPSILFGYNDSVGLQALQVATGATTLLSAISYIYKRGSYKIK